jgi:endonuclease G
MPLRRFLLWAWIVCLVVSCGKAPKTYDSASPPPAVAITETLPALDIEGAHRHSIFGKPRHDTAPLILLENIGYLAAYDTELRIPRWVCYRLFPTGPVRIGPRPRQFSPDPRVPDSPRHDDYNNCGYDRGHMAPSAAIAQRYGEQAQLETFRITNIAPQLPGLNQETWEAFERIESIEYGERFDSLWVITGPILEGPCMELHSGIRVPSAFFKIVLALKEERPVALAIVMPQETRGLQRLDSLVVTVRDIERRTGLDFFHELPDAIERAIEESPPAIEWNPTRELKPSFKAQPRPIQVRPCAN